MKSSILYLTNAYPDSKKSYRGIFIHTMAHLLKEEGYQISVVTPKIYKCSSFIEDQSGIIVYRFPFFAKNKLLIEYQKTPYLKMILYLFSGLITSLYGILRRKCKFIHIHWIIPIGLIGLIINFFIKKPYLVTVHGTDLRIALEKKGIFKKMFFYICKRASHIHCVSKFQKIELLRMGLPEEKISVFPMGVNIDFIKYGMKRESDLQKNNFTILSNRNLVPIYNVSLFIRSIPIIIKEFPNVKFVIAGEGPEREKLEKEVDNLNLRSSVKFIGRILHKEMPELLTTSDIYVSTSLYDGTSVSLLEAMASGCFPVVSDIPSNREWIEDGKNGFLFPVDDENTLAKKILQAIHDNELRKKARKLNYFLIQERTLWPVCIYKTKQIYEAMNNWK